MRKHYDGLDEPWSRRAATLNHRLENADLPVRVANMSSIWTVFYTRPSRYNWMLQYYLRAEGLALSWVGTGRLIFSLNFDDGDFAAAADRFIDVPQVTERHGRGWEAPGFTPKGLRPGILLQIRAHPHGSRPHQG